MKNSLAIVGLLVLAVVVGTTPAWALPPAQEAKLLPADGASEDWFGENVALHGDTAVIGAHGNDDNGENSGSAYVFTRTAGVWTEQAKLLPADGASWDSFGRSVAIDGNTAVIGADGDDDNGENAGSAYVFSPVAGVPATGVVGVLLLALLMLSTGANFIHRSAAHPRKSL